MNKMPEPFGIVTGEERGYSDWYHVVTWQNQHMPKGTKFYTEEHIRDALDKVPDGVLTAIRNAGLTLVRNNNGYHLMKLGPIVAQAMEGRTL